jgi:hypothetical protein
MPGWHLISISSSVREMAGHPTPRGHLECFVAASGRPAPQVLDQRFRSRSRGVASSLCPTPPRIISTTTTGAEVTQLVDQVP